MTSKERHEARYQRRVAKRRAKKEKLLEDVDTLEKLIDFDNFIKAFFKCRKGVGWKFSVQNYRIHLFKNIYATIKLITKGKKVTKGFVEFDINERGKNRHIKSVHISERVVQKLCCLLFLTKIIDRSLIYDNSASTRGKGTHFCLNRLRCHLQRFYRRYGNKGYIAILDIKGFFDHILHIEVYKKVKGLARDRRIVELIMQFVDAFNPLFKTKNKLTKIQKFKRRMHGVSLGLGSEVSQTFAKSYTNEIDHYMKEVLHIEAYAHYMDDFYMISKSKEHLKRCIDIFKQKLKEIGLQLNEIKCKIVRLRNTFSFLKVKHNLLDSGKVLRRVGRKNVTRMRHKLKKMYWMLRRGIIPYSTVYTCYQSWKGHIKHKQVRKTKYYMDKLYNRLFIEDWLHTPMDPITGRLMYELVK